MTDAPRVKVAQGALEGVEEAGVYRFLGIPYAAPPVGDLRWRPPVAPADWTGVRPAKTFSPIAIQTVGGGPDCATAEQSEDCLYLNVWTRVLGAGANQPVMVWIHGGGNLGGAGSESAFDGSALSGEGVTVVTFNYRLGAFGFLAHPDVGANFGVLDYVAALEWVRDNIDAFGGDPNNVTVFGESAGAVAVRTLLSTPRSRGLFHKAIIQSAGFEPPSFAPGWSYDRARNAADALFERLGGGGVDALRRVPAADLKLASHELSGIFPQPGRVHTPANLVWMPVPDGEVIPHEGFPGWPQDVPVMFGCLENEARYFIRPTGEYPPEVLVNMARALAGPLADEVLALFERKGEETYPALDHLFSTVIWFEPALATVERFSALGRTFHYYHFARVSPGARRSNELVKHSAEIRYVFGNLQPAEDYDAVDEDISREMRHAWVSFARDGVPTTTGGEAWPQFSADDPRMAHIEDEVTMRPFAVTDVTAILHRLRRSDGETPTGLTGADVGAGAGG